jgi:hypothetical protein
VLDGDDVLSSEPPPPPPGTPQVFVLGVWEPEDGAIDRAAVQRCVHAAFDRYDVEAMWCDPFGWFTEIDEWQHKYGERAVVKFATNQRSKWAESCNTTYTAITNGWLTHDGHPDLARHLRSAAPHRSESREFATFGKVHPASQKKVDAAVALTLALHARHATTPPARLVVY